MTKQQIVNTLKNHLLAQMEKHRMNVEIMINNPMAIHDHTAWTEGVESELSKMAEYHDKHEMVAKFLGHYSEGVHIQQKVNHEFSPGENV
tara:strand:- start:582 stop:851 length:270 start_codon:yes stop_codon:yes gene_type:complete